MSLIVLGVNHRTAPIEVRERLSISETHSEAFLTSVRSIQGVRGAALLSTCNRVEIVVSSDDEDVIEPVIDHLRHDADLDRATLENHLYVLRNGEVVRHLFRVASGLDSMILGEPQIGGQVRQAYQFASTHGMLDPVLQQLFDATLRAARRVRTETGISEHAVSIPYAAVELARKIFGDLKGLEVVLAGAGKIGELTAQHLSGFGLKSIFVANRAFVRATELAHRFGGEAIRFEDLESRLFTSDILIASTTAPHFILNAEDVERAMVSRRRRSLFLIDLSVPRNLDPAIAAVEGAYLYNIDDLADVAQANREKRQGKTNAAEELIAREADGFLRKLAGHDAVPTILELQSRLEQIRKNELEKCLRRLGPITTHQQEAVEMLSTSIINKVLHYPILRLKESAADAKPEERESFRNTIRKIFGIG